MNKERRKLLSGLVDRLEDIKGELETLKEEEEQYNENIPDNLKQGTAAEVSDAAISEMDDAVNNLDMVIDSLNNAQQ